MKQIKLTIILLLSTVMGVAAQVKIGFEVSFREPQAHYAEVKMNIGGLVKDYIDVKMPVWTPGSYLIREFPKSVEDFSATASGKSVKTQKIDKNTWRVYSAKSSAVQIEYRVYAFEISVRTSFIDASHGFLSPTSIFMFPDGLIKTPSTVKIIPHKTWSKVSTGLEKIAGDFTYRAKDFDILFDSPIEVGNQDVFEFTAAGVKHEVAMYGGGNYDKEKLKVDMAKIVEEATAVYGENPNKYYVFIVHNYATGGGGLEHLNSTTLGASRNGYNTPRGYNSFLGLVAHEYGHLWNVKRLRPIALGPFDYSKENYTTDLWISEGFTSYYGSKFMYRAGFNTQAGFVSGVAGSIAGIENSAGAKKQSAAASSFDSWIIQYRPNENSKNMSISYYSKGEVIGALMDIEIAHATKGKKGLDDLMNAMYYQGKKLNRGFTDAEFKAMAEKISGISFTDFWAKYVTGTAPVDYKKYFGFAGIIVKNENEGKTTPFLGISTKRTEGKLIVSGISRDSGAWIDGVNVNDELISIDGATPEIAQDRSTILTKKEIGDVVKVSVIRDRIPMDINVKLTALSTVRLTATIDPDATPEQKAVLARWTGNQQK